MVDQKLNAITEKVIGASIEVHKNLGPGLLESVYHKCLCIELQYIGVRFEKEVIIPIHYRNSYIETTLKADLLVENEIIVELKSVNEILPIHQAQLLSYLKLMNKKLGILINFNVPMLKDGVKRMLNASYSSEIKNEMS